MKYEYKTIAILDHDGKGVLERELNILGAYGWELVGYNCYGGNWHYCVLKRVKIG